MDENKDLLVLRVQIYDEGKEDFTGEEKEFLAVEKPYTVVQNRNRKRK